MFVGFCVQPVAYPANAALSQAGRGLTKGGRLRTRFPLKKIILVVVKRSLRDGRLGIRHCLGKWPISGEPRIFQYESEVVDKGVSKPA